MSSPDRQSYASRPGKVRLSIERFRALQLDTRGLNGWVYRRFQGGQRVEESLAQHLRDGDTNPAVVVSTSPELIVAAYTPDIDCVALLWFPSWLIPEYHLSAGTRLLTVNRYAKGSHVASDLEPGPDRSAPWTNFVPVIAEFVSDDRSRITELKRQISDDEWRRCQTLGQAAFSRLTLEQTAAGQLALGLNAAARPRARVRDGSPLRCGLPATVLVAPSRAAQRVKWCLSILGIIALCCATGVVTGVYWLTIPVVLSPIVLPVLILSYVDWVRQGAVLRRRGWLLEVARAPIRLLGLGLVVAGFGTWVLVGYEAVVRQEPRANHLRAAVEFGIPTIVLGLWWLRGAGGRRPDLVRWKLKQMLLRRFRRGARHSDGAR